jgi:hypothetical protein
MSRLSTSRSSTKSAANAAIRARTERVKKRVQLLIQITSRSRSYRKGLVGAAKHLTPEEAAIIADLEWHGMQVPQLHDVLCGGHVLVDDPDLYDQWRFDKVSRERMSSHHKSIDKSKYPDIGMHGQVVREKLHGRTAQGTWVQLEKTPAAFGKKKLPTVNDVRHLWDFVVYRITRSNVGPWGLSKQTERRPMYLSPNVAVPHTLPPAIAGSLTAALQAIEDDDDVTAVSQDLATKFSPPDRADPTRELGALSKGSGRGLFGSSDVWVTETQSRTAAAVMHDEAERRPERNVLVEMGLR